MSYQRKPPAPIWQPQQAPAGCKLYLPLVAGAGTTVRDLSGRSGVDGTFTGSPVWQMGPCGPQIGGFTTSNYVAIDPPVQILAVTYPWWMAVLTVNTGTAQMVPISQGLSSSATPKVLLFYNDGGVANRINIRVTSDAATLAFVTADNLPCNDGLPHVVMAGMIAPNVPRLYFDGVKVGSSSATTLSTLTSDRLTIGATRTTSVSSAFAGSVIAAAAGNGAFPDPMALAQDWLSGRFAAVRPIERAWLPGAVTVGGLRPVGSGLIGSPLVSGGLVA